MSIATRTGPKVWFIRGLLVLIIISFMVWGVESVRIGGGTTVAQVGDVRVTPREYERAFRLEQMRRSGETGALYTRQQAVADGIDKQVLERLVLGAALDQAAYDLGLHVSDARIARAIQDETRFHGADGKFDPAVYRQEVQQIGFDDVSFEAEQRRLIQRADLVGALSAGVVVPEAVVQAIHSHGTEVRWARYVGIPAAAMTKIPEPTEADLRAYYDSHLQAYSLPEYRGFSFVLLNPTELADKGRIADEVVAREYEARKASFSKPETRDLKQIIVADEARARALKQRLDEGADFLAVAREAGISQAEATVTGADKSKLAYLGEQAADTAFSLPEGAVSEPVSGKLGWVLFKVERIVPGQVTSFEEARPQIVEDLADRQIAAALDDLATKARTQIAEGVTIQQLAQSLGLRLRTVPAMDAKGLDPAGNAVPGVPAGKAFTESLFAKAEGDFIDLEDDGENGYFVLELDKIEPAKVRPFAEVKEQVRADWTREARNSAARSVAQGIVDKVRGGASLSMAATDAGGTVATTPPVSRARASQLGGAFSPELISAMFDAPKGGVALGPSARGDGYFVIQVVEVNPVPLDTRSEEYARLKDMLYDSLRMDILAQYQTYLFDEYSVSRNLGIVDQIVGQQQ
jgi:peptidyl-prolyl cis-trans isomerase D